MSLGFTSECESGDSRSRGQGGSRDAGTTDERAVTERMMRVSRLSSGPFSNSQKGLSSLAALRSCKQHESKKGSANPKKESAQAQLFGSPIALVSQRRYSQEAGRGVFLALGSYFLIDVFLVTPLLRQYPASHRRMVAALCVFSL
jgi:hypothetical protein